MILMREGRGWFFFFLRCWVFYGWRERNGDGKEETSDGRGTEGKGWGGGMWLVGAIFRHRQGWKVDWELCCRLARWKHVYVSDYYVDKNHVWSLYFNISSNQLLYSLVLSVWTFRRIYRWSRVSLLNQHGCYQSGLELLPKNQIIRLLDKLTYYQANYFLKTSFIFKKCTSFWSNKFELQISNFLNIDSTSLNWAYLATRT